MKLYNNSLFKKLYPYILLLMIVIIAFILRSSLVTYNLPVSGNVDERTSYNILYRFQNKSLNPEFFNYPTLYFYSNFFITKFFIDNGNYLLSGRILNLLIGCALGIAVFFLARLYYKSNLVGLLAAFFTLFSPIIIYNSSYIITDPLMVLFIIISIFFLVKFFNSSERNIRYLLWGAVFSGLAFSTKYSALLFIIGYLLFEVIYQRLDQEETHIINKRINNLFIVSLVFLSALFFIGLYIFFPQQYLESIVGSAGGINSQIDASDLQFLGYIKSLLLFSGFGLLVFAIICLCFRKICIRFCLIRLYVFLGIVLFVFIAGSPYILISFKDFLYDFGLELKTNKFINEDAQSPTYLLWFFKYESIMLLLFFIIGIWASIKKKININIMLFYFIITCIFIGRADRGFPRYLTPILPILFIISAQGIVYCARLLKIIHIRYLIIFYIVVISLFAIEISPKVLAVVQKLSGKDEMYLSYEYVKSINPDTVFFTDYAPSIELKIAGYNVKQIPLVTISDNSVEYQQFFGKNDLVILEGDSNTQVSQKFLNIMNLEWKSEKGYQQYIYRIK